MMLYKANTSDIRAFNTFSIHEPYLFKAMFLKTIKINKNKKYEM